ncbi:uncharacterized protein [Watersipora subatra]|uniref:uncharacterized protein n=1 Tax=Watersipora subatra TaxID=2589382 RepID=UPI00355B68AD
MVIPLHSQNGKWILMLTWETEGLTNIEPLRHLKRFVSGKAYDAISGHFLTNTLSAYYDARAVLKHRFGNKHSVSRALRKKLSEFSKIGPKNSSLLREYADLLAHVRSAMSDVTQLNILDDSEENEKLVAKLPDFMIRSWVKTVKERRQARKPYPDFKEFTSFVIDHAEIMEEPLMQLTSMNLKDKPKQQRIYPSARVSALATSTGYANSCICCKKPHATAECYTLRDMKAAQQEAFVKQHRLCFGCLGSSDHKSKECPKRATCKKCQKRHPTALHREPHEWERNRSTDTKAPETQTNTSGGMKMETKPDKQYTNTLKESQGNTAREDSLQKTKKLDVKFTSCAEKGLNMILPVYVSSQFDPQKEVLIYAMLDSQSDSTFLTTDVGGMLNTDTTIEDVQMETLNGSTLEKINLHHNILVRGFHECTKLSIAAYAWNDFSCDKDQIPTRDNLAKYEHLIEISKFLPPLLDIPVAMLIGRDCPDAFAPIEAIRGRKGQPFAEKTVLGWTAMGSGKRQNGRKTPRVSVNACNTFAKILSDDSDTLSSQDDIKFMEIWSTGTVQRNDEYFQMPLPFRSRSKLPNNRLQAALLATWLSKTPQHELDLRIDEEHYWSDSQIVLSYIANDSKRFQIYVANRVHEIREHSQVTQWHHIAGEHNPADIASRGIGFHKLMKSIRFHGPEFLKEKQTYPSAKQTDFQAKLGQTDPEVRRIKKCNTKMKQPNPVLKLIEHFSTKIRLLRVVGTLQKMVRNKSWKLEPLEAVKCVTCRTLRGKSSSRQMGDLPLERTGKYPPPPLGILV